MKTAFFFMLAFAGLNALSQTKPVAHRSHSGNMRYMAESAVPDNLGWGGTPIMAGDDIADSVPFMSIPLLSPDSLANYPYCNNPSIPADSIQKNFPFYAETMKKELQQNDTVIPAPVDTVGMSHQELKTKNDQKRNEVLPISQPYGNDNVSGWKPGYGTILVFSLAMLLTGAFIWVTNRNNPHIYRDQHSA